LKELAGTGGIIPDTILSFGRIAAASFRLPTCGFFSFILVVWRKLGGAKIKVCAQRWRYEGTRRKKE
jgi:hypothetical protein